MEGKGNIYKPISNPKIMSQVVTRLSLNKKRGIMTTKPVNSRNI